MAALRRVAGASAAWLGKEERARGLLVRAREARSVLDPAQRRELRDEQATRVVLAVVLRASSNAIDVGANEGAVLKEIVRLAPAGRHIAFEPIPGLHQQLRESFPGVEVRRAALSDVAGTTEFTHVVGAEAYSGLRQRSDLPSEAAGIERISVQVERLDDALPSDYVPTLLKIDVEGAELQVLRGAAETLARHRPFVLFEHGPGGADLYGTGPGEVFDLLADAAMNVFDLDGTGPYSRERFEATFSEPIWNFLAVPR
jgi:FkbM family methyltransferase